MRFRATVVASFLLALFALPAAGQEPPADPAQVADSDAQVDAASDAQPADPDEAQVVPSEAQVDTASDDQIEELLRRIDLLAAELEQLRSGESPAEELTDERRRSLGLAPSAAAVYRVSQGVSFSGYGEMLLENFAGENESGVGGAPTTRLDFLRHILYTGYRFNDRFLFNSEIEIEHSNEVSVELAIIDYRASNNLTLRAGMILLPLGLVNEFHEPTVFVGARRPETEQRILPTTWRENGVGVLGSAGIVSFRAYVTNGLRGAGFSSAGLRGGRQKGARALAANLAFSGRLDVTPVPGIVAGLGLYNGASGQEQVTLDDARVGVGTRIIEAHGQVQVRGFDLRALFAQTSIEGAGDASRALGLPVDASIAETMQGGFLQASYNLLSQVTTPVALSPYVRYERIDTQHRVPDGFVRDVSRDSALMTLGIELKPILNVVLKTDYQWITNEAGTGRNQFNVNLGYAF